MDHNKSIHLETARTRLAKIWFAGSALIGSILIGQSLMNRYAGLTQDAWAWLLPTLMPTSGMILSSLVTTAFHTASAETFVRHFFYRISMWLSCFYLLAVLATILVQPLSGVEAVDNMQKSNIWLGPLQGLLGLALGALFVSKEQRSQRKDEQALLQNSEK